MPDINDPNDMNEISAKNTDNIEEAPDPDAVADPAASDGSDTQTDDVTTDDSLRTYQDDLDTGDDDTDPIMDEETEDPTEELQIPAGEFKDELDKMDLGDHTEQGNEDMRETIEDRDEDDNNSASAPQ